MFKISDLRRREILHLRSVCPFVLQCVCVGGGGGGTLIFSYTRRLWLFWGVQIFEFQYIFFLGGVWEGLWIFLGGHHKIGLYLEVISMHFRVFSEGHGTEWRIFWVTKTSNIYLGCLKFMIYIYIYIFFFFLGGGGGG